MLRAKRKINSICLTRNQKYFKNNTCELSAHLWRRRIPRVDLPMSSRCCMGQLLCARNSTVTGEDARFSARIVYFQPRLSSVSVNLSARVKRFSYFYVVSKENLGRKFGPGNMNYLWLVFICSAFGLIGAKQQIRIGE